MTSFVSSRSCAILLNIRLKWPYLVRRSKIPWKSFRLTPSTPTVSDLKARWASSKTPKSPKKSRATVRLDDLPQGVLASPSVNHDAAQDAFQYPTVIQQARNNMRNYDDCVVLTRVGNFYELYLEHAEEYGPLLNLKVAQKKTSVGNVAMSGFQYQYLTKYLRILVMDLRKHVAISEEFPNDVADRAKSGGLFFDRKVDRVVTAGTLIDEEFLDPDKNNYLLSILLDSNFENRSLGLAWLDLSSSRFFVQTVDIPSLASVLARISPSEVVIDKAFEESALANAVLSTLKEARCRVTWHRIPDQESSFSSWPALLERPLTDGEKKKFSVEELGAVGLILHYVQDRLQRSNTKLQIPARQSDFLSIDRYSINALEIKTTLRDGLFKGSLLHVLRRTVTRGGSRLLADRLLWPSMHLSAIDSRLDLVERFSEDAPFRYEIQKLLRRTFDTSRLLTKFSLGRADADDLLGLSKSINTTTDISECIKSFRSNNDDLDEGSSPNGSNTVLDLLERIDIETPSILANRITDAIDEEGLSEQWLTESNETDTAVSQESPDALIAPISDPKFEGSLAETGNRMSTRPQREIPSEPWIMKRHASTNLMKIHKSLDGLWVERDDLMKDLRHKMGVPNLTLRITPGMGHFCHLKHRTATKLIERLEGARILSSSKSTASFHYPAWSRLGERMETLRMRIRAEEQQVFGKLCDEVDKQLSTLRRNAGVLDELDVACSYATVASERNWVRPMLNNGTSQTIIGGRHPMVDLGLAEKGVGFTANDCRMNPQEKLLFITGPNMAGKSTYLRQNALITILAQTGSFVPAIYAEMGLVDKVFSRVGSADNLSRDQSTFMVEMLESAEILKNATERSFVIMDEVGRGTTPEDGIALGFACLDHLVRINKCRALFATHFHVLADLTKDFGNVGYYCTDVLDDGKGFSYIHRLRQGVNRESHALKVAKLARLPDEAVEVAAKVLKQLNSGKASQVTATNIEPHSDSVIPQNLSAHSVDGAG